MVKPEPVVLDIQNVSQKTNAENISVDNVSKLLRSMIIKQTQRQLEDGNIEIVLILDPKVQKINGGQ